jgi:hypothetical protein
VDINLEGSQADLQLANAIHESYTSMRSASLLPSRSSKSKGRSCMQ